MSKYQFRWIGFKVVRGKGYVGGKLKRIGFFRGGENMGFDYVKPCGKDVGSSLARMRESNIKGIAYVFTDANWEKQSLTAKQKQTNYAD